MSAIQYNEDSPGITNVAGFQCGSAACDIRENGEDRIDLTLIHSKTSCSSAGVFTDNDLKAAPVIQGLNLLASRNDIHGIVANSGNANAATGNDGKTDCAEMAKLAATKLNAPDNSFFVCSTGRIGRKLPMKNLRAGIGKASENMGYSAEHGKQSALAILTSDTKSKSISATITYGDSRITLGAIAKGAGMIEPNMATMLAFITTDAQATSPWLQKALTDAVNASFNAITVDGDMSTNDTVLLLANGASKTDVTEDSELSALFREALTQICKYLARKIVQDGERVTKCVDLLVKGAKSDSDARRTARAIANSLLVKTSWYGSDPNWGRIACAAGYAKAGLTEEKLDIIYNDTPALKKGVPIDANLEKIYKIAALPEFKITVDLNLGSACYEMLASDLTEGYVDFNKSE